MKNNMEGGLGILQTHRLRMAALAVLMATLSACGGGGGGGGGASPPTIPPGSFTLSASSASFDAIDGTAPPPAKTATVTITGGNVAAVGAAYPAGQSKPAWLNVNLTGSGTTFTLSVSVDPSAAPPGSYSTTFDVGTGDAAGNILAHQSFTVDLTLEAHIAITSAPVAATFAFGDNPITQALSVAVTAPNRSWSASSDAAWLRASAGPYTGNGALSATVDATGIAPGTYIGHVTATDAQDSTDTAALMVTLTVSPAALAINESSFTFGGADGLSVPTPLPVDFSLSTGHASYPYSIALMTTSGGNWLKVDSASGTVGAAGATVNLSVDRTGLKGGTYGGQVTISSTVNGTTFQQQCPVTLNIEANRLVVTASGVGLTSIAGQSVLTRTVQVLSAIGRTDVPWSANSDNPWLSVTANGTTGGNLVLTANTSGIPLDTTQFAQVTITSSDPTVENSPTIRVGLLVSNTAPITTPIALSANALAASPVEPIVAIGTGGTGVGIYDVNSGSLLRTLNGVAAATGTLMFSEDGVTLFVADTTNLRVTAVNASSGALGTVYDASPQVSNSAGGTGIGVSHPNGYAMLFVPNGHAYDLATGTAQPTSSALSNLTSAQAYAGTPDQTLLANEAGIATRVVRSALNGSSLVLTSNVLSPSTAQGRSGQSCFSANGDRIYTASGAPYNFPATSLSSGQVIQTLAGDAYPDSVQCSWNGLVIGGIDGYYDANDIFVYYGPTGVSLTDLSSNGPGTAYRDLNIQGLAVSSDGTRLISAWGSAVWNNGVYFQSLPPPPP